MEGCVFWEGAEKLRSDLAEFCSCSRCGDAELGPLFGAVDGTCKTVIGHTGNLWQAGHCISISSPSNTVSSLQQISREIQLLVVGKDSASQSQTTPISSLIAMTDRRRINGPVGGTLPPIFAGDETTVLSEKATGRTRPVNTARPICEFSCCRSPKTSLTLYQSPQNWGHPFSIWLCIF